EYVPGSTLKDVLAREGGLGWTETVYLMTQVLDALACAHARGVVHRDLKPENIMVTKTGARRNALVLDFGLGGFTREASGWALPRLTMSRELIGTPCYAARADVPASEPVPEGERRQVTVVSCGITVMSAEGLPPDIEELDELLHGEHERLGQLAMRAGGHVAAVTGGSLLIAFGYPSARE